MQFCLQLVKRLAVTPTCWQMLGRSTVLAGLASTLLVAGVKAQQPDVQAGQRVRVSHNGSQTVGTVVAVLADTPVLEVEAPAGRRAVPLATLDRLEVSLGRKTQAGKGALIGLLVGGVAGVATGVLVCAPNPSCEGEDDSLTGLVALFFGGIGALAGTGIGALIGGITLVEQWQPIPLDRVSLGISPHGHRGFEFSVSIGIRFDHD